MRYTAFGLCFDSEIELPELTPADPAREPDVTIRLGSTPTQLDSVTGDGVFYTLNHDEFLLTYDRVGSFYVHHGQEIVIQPADDMDWPFLRLMLFDSPLGALLHQRKVFALRAAAIDTPRGAMLFCGSSTIGKSTLAAAFAQRGYPIIADEICALTFDADNHPIVYPGKRVQQLWLEALNYLEIDHQPLTKTLPEKELYALPLEPLEADRFTPVHIFHLSYANHVAVTDFEPVTGLAKLDHLAHQSYFHFFLSQMDRSTQHHALLVKLISQLPITTIRRENQLKYIPDTLDQVEREYIV